MRKVVIIGAGCAGWTAAIYTSRANLEPLMLTGKDEGGQLMLTTDVENYPGFPDAIKGPELMENMKKQAIKYGTEVKQVSATSFEVKEDGTFEIIAGEEKIQAKSVIISTGADARMLGLPSEKEYLAKGIHTCATCDGFFYKDKEIIVVGGGDSACEESGFLSNLVSKITILVRKDEMRASKIMLERVEKNPKIEIVYNASIEEFKGDGMKLTSVMINKDGRTSEMKIDGVFLAIGHIPNTKIFEGIIDLDEHGFIKTDGVKTNVKGVFAGGDVQDPIWKQAVTAAGTGCMAALSAERYNNE